MRGANGLVVSSDDPAAVRRLQQLVEELTSAEASLKVFTLKNGNATEVATLLTAAYAPRTPTTVRTRTTATDSKFRWPGFDNLQSDGAGIGSLRPDEPVIRFLADPLTNTVLVQGASDRRLTEIEQLITSYDQVPSPDTQPTRRTKIVKVKYASATELTKVVKDVFRDLLSPDDPAILANIPPDQRRQPYGNRGASSRNNKPQYKGLLSVGVNEELNTLVISAPDEIMTQVTSLVERLDADALAEQPVAEVRQVTGIVHDRLLRAVLNNAVDPESETSVSVDSRGQGERRDDGRRRNYGRGR
jgi:type II secretory pathway component GspD/PulD (secretin)